MLKKILVTALVSVLAACYNGDAQTKYSFRHQQGKYDYDDYMYYDDSIFDMEASQFNPKLASASIGFAMASFASMDATDYANKSQNAKRLLTSIGFTDFDVNENYKKKPGADTIGLLAAKKQIGEYTVVAIGIRGAAYYSEWASNFTLGNRDDHYHQGFYQAAEEYVSWSKKYFETHNITGKVKIWTSGYSRAGATCNIASGLFADMLNKGEKPFGDKVELTRNHFYSYCFEAPKGAPRIVDSKGKVTAKSADYNNIINMVNVNDPVPMVAMTELGFTRYGRDMYMPDPLTTLHYEDHFANMYGLYNAVSNHSVLGEYRILNFKYVTVSGDGVGSDQSAHSMSQALFLKEFVSDLVLNGLTGNGKRSLDECLEYYDTEIQTGLRNVFKLLYESETFVGSIVDVGVSLISDLSILDQIDGLISDILVEGKDAFVNDIKQLLIRGLNKMDMDCDAMETVNNLVAFLGVVADELIAAFMFGKQYELLNFLSLDNIKAIASGHYPELCAAHVRALDSQYVSNPYTDYEKMSGQYYRLTVYDSDTSIVIKNGNDIIVRINDGGEINNHISYFKHGSYIEIFLPYYEEYQVTLGEKNGVYLEYFDSNLETYVDAGIDETSIKEFTIKPANN